MTDRASQKLFPTGWRMRRADERDERSFRARHSTIRRLWSVLAAMRWVAVALAVVLLAAAGAAYLSGGGHSAEALLVARRAGSGSPRTSLSAEEAAAVRQEIISPAIIEAAAGRMSGQEAASEAREQIERALAACAQAGTEAGRAEVHIICRGASAEQSVRGANALAEALAAARRGDAAGSAFDDQKAEQALVVATRDLQLFSRRNSVELLDSQREAARTRVDALQGELDGATWAERAEIRSELARQSALLESLERVAGRLQELEERVTSAQQALGIKSEATPDESGNSEHPLRFSVLETASLAKATRTSAQWRLPAAAAALVLGVLAFAGFVGRGKRRLRSVEDIVDIFGAPAAVLERGGRADVS